MGEPLSSPLPLSQQIVNLRSQVMAQICDLYGDKRCQLPWAAVEATAHRLKEQLRTLDPTKASPKQMQQMALDLEATSHAIAELKSHGIQGRNFRPFNLTDAQIADTRKNLGRLGRFRVWCKASVHTARPLTKLLSKVKDSGQLLYQALEPSHRSASVDLDGRIATASEQIAKLSDDLTNIEMQGQLLSSQWSKEMRDKYVSLTFHATQRLQWLRWQLDAFENVKNNTSVQAALQAEAQIHQMLHGLRRKDAPAKLDEATKLLTEAEDKLAALAPESMLYIVAAQALKAARQEIDVAKKKWT